MFLFLIFQRVLLFDCKSYEQTTIIHILSDTKQIKIEKSSTVIFKLTVHDSFITQCLKLGLQSFQISGLKFLVGLIRRMERKLYDSYSVAKAQVIPMVRVTVRGNVRVREGKG